MSKQLMLTFQSDTYQSAWQQFDHDSFRGPLFTTLPARFIHGRVKTQGPFSVTATICSKCAE